MTRISKSAHAKPDVFVHVASIPKNPLDESIYDLLPIEIQVPERPPQYKSVHADEVRKEFKECKKIAASMGPPKVVVPPPIEYLRKGDGLVHLKKAHIDEPHHRSPITRAPVPKLAHQKFAPPVTNKDFIEGNKRESATTALKKPPTKVVEYRKKRDYGIAPEYLVKRKIEKKEQEVKMAIELKEKREKDEMIRRGIIPLPEEERQRLLAGLKANWESLNQEYMKLSLTVDTLPKINRKVGLERQLKQLEDQMTKLSYPKILVNFQSSFF